MSVIKPLPRNGTETDMLVSEILAIKGKVLFTIGPNRPIAEAVEIMNEQDVGSLVVFSRGEMVGMLTFRQVLQAVQKGGADWQALQRRGGHVARSAGRRARHGDGRIAPTDGRASPALPAGDGRHTLLGVVSFHDVAKAVLEEQSFENRMLKNYIRNWPAGEER
jgi:CBS domain-containing protein